VQRAFGILRACSMRGRVSTSIPFTGACGTTAVRFVGAMAQWAHRTADFLICGECGVFVAAITDTSQGKRAVINARVLDGVSLNWVSVVDVHFDDEGPPQRADRRSLHWTAVGDY
jgi:hypothetical protein